MGFWQIAGAKLPECTACPDLSGSASQ